MIDVKTLLRLTISVAGFLPLLTICMAGVVVAQEQSPCTLKGAGPDPKAVIQQIRVGDNNYPPEKKAAEVVIIQAGSQVTMLGELGCALFPKDRLKTEPNVEVTLSFPVEAEDGGKEFVEVILVGKTEVEISSLTARFGTFIVRAKSALKKLKGRFSVKMDRGDLGINGTEYTLTIPAPEEPARDTTLLVTEGQVVFESKSPSATVQPTPSPSPATSDTSIAVSAVPTTPPSPLSEVINSGEKVVITVAGAVIKQEVMKDEGGQLDRDSEVIFSALPTYTARYILPSVDSHQQRLADFKQARRQIFLKEGGRQGLAASYETLARVYSDLGSGKDALKALKIAEELYSGDDDDDDDKNDRQTSWSPSAQFLTLRGKAYLLTGDLEEAEKDLTEALQKSSNSFEQRWALEALGALIGVSLRETVEELKDKDNEGAEKAFNEAKSLVARLGPLEPRLQALTPALKAALLTTIGEISLRSGDIELARNEENRLQKAFEHYTKAEQWCSAAQKADENNAFALLCLGDANRDLGTVSRTASNAARQIDEAINFYKQAESRYEEAFKKHNYFAEAQSSLRNLYAVRAEFYRLPKWKQVFEQAADKSSELAIKLDPKAFLEEVEVPDVEGKTQAVAAKLLTEAGLVPEIEGVGLVYEQNLETGKSVKRGTSITIKAKFPANFRVNTKYVRLSAKQ